MGKKRCIDVMEIAIAADFAVCLGEAEVCDSYNNIVEYRILENSKGKKLFCIDKPCSHNSLEIGTYGELVRKSITGNICKIAYYDENKKEYCYANWWDTVLVNNPAHPLYGCLVRKEDGYIIASNDKVLD